MERSISDTTTISMENTPPTVVATLSQSNLYRHTDRSVSAMSDVDARTVTGTIEWHVVDALTGSDNTVQTDSTTTLDGGLFNKGDQIYAVVTPNDGIEDGSSFTTSSIEVLNTLPSAPVISLGPSNPDIDTDNVTCQVDSPSVDMDSDVIEYTFDWTLLDGSLIQSTLTQNLSDVLSSGTLFAQILSPAKSHHKTTKAQVLLYRNNRRSVRLPIAQR